MSDREALAAALDTWDKAAQQSPQFLDATKLLALAALKYLAQLPEKCGTCNGMGVAGGNYGAVDCPPCHGSGKVYQAELVERIARIIARHGDGTYPNSKAVAVLDALNSP